MFFINCQKVGIGIAATILIVMTVFSRFHRSVRSSDLHNSQVGNDTGTMSSPRRLELVFKLVFLVLAKTFNTAASVFFARLYNELKTHYLRISVPFLLRVTS